MAKKQAVRRSIRRAVASNGTQRSMPEPSRGRPTFSTGYGIKTDDKGLVAWKDACAQLAKSRNYWVATSRPDGRPHSMPVWGV
ncbi:MAG: pyridoxamine 5'-phosphate oxidase family protein [Candidatus Acidiferrales bacterium]